METVLIELEDCGIFIVKNCLLLEHNLFTFSLKPDSTLATLTQSFFSHMLLVVCVTFCVSDYQNVPCLVLQVQAI